MNKSVLQSYTALLKGHQVKQKATQSLSRRWSIYRTAYFLGGISLLFILGENMLWLWFIIALIGLLYGFALLIKKHQKINEENELQKKLIIINNNEINSITNNDHSAYFDGGTFLEVEHPYAVDLDIVGENSIFQYINRTSTYYGSKKLADYMLSPSSIELIEFRQKAIIELKNKTSWRQKLIALGNGDKDVEQDLILLENWLIKDDFIINNKLWRLMIWMAPIFTIGAALICYFGFPWYVALLPFIPTALALKSTFDDINETQHDTNHTIKTLEKYSQLISHIEAEKFDSAMLSRWQKKYFSENKGGNASIALEDLSFAIDQLNTRSNFFSIFFNLAFLTDFRNVKKLELWRQIFKNQINQWLHVLGDFDAIVSMANCYHNNPNWSFPEIDHNLDYIQAINFGHPLIPFEVRINNNFTIKSSQHISLLTGSNMAGKSTFMRSLGVNLVFALSGMPVPAQEFSCPPIQVYTSMRTKDNLNDRSSSFYAELKRLKNIIQTVESGKKVFFLLDEILKGTNSNDRHKGSQALIKQLLATQSAGIIATHDLELSIMAKDYPNKLSLHRMEVQIKDGKLYFDYKIQEGVSRSFNATILMQQMGIKV